MIMILNFFQLVSYALAAIFWMASASGMTVEWPWRTPRAVPPNELGAHQARWNRNAAGMTGAGVIFQMILFLVQNYKIF
jgi:hypothetical protein